MSLSESRLEYIQTEQTRAIHDMQTASDLWRKGGCFWDSRYAELQAAQERFNALNIIDCVMRHPPGGDIERLIQTVKKLVKP